MRRNNKKINIKKIVSILILIIMLIIIKKPMLKSFNYVKNGANNLNSNLVIFKSTIYENIDLFKEKIQVVSDSDKYIKNIENKEIEYQNQKLKLNDYEQIKKENLKLRNLLDIKERIKYKTISAEVKLVEDINYEDVIYIKKGKNKGIIEGQVVIYNGSMIGIISKVFDEYSQVRLLVSQESKISVVLNGSYLGVLRGNGNGTFSIKNYNTDIENYDNIKFLIKTSGVSDYIMKDIYIGTYGIRNVEEFKETKELIFKPEYNYGDIDFVLIIKEVK